MKTLKENEWRLLVLKHTDYGSCNFQAAAEELVRLFCAEERERCAKVCESLTCDAKTESGPDAARWLDAAAAKIRSA